MAKKDPAKLPQAVSAGGAAAGGPSQKGPETKVDSGLLFYINYAIVEDSWGWGYPWC